MTAQDEFWSRLVDVDAGMLGLLSDTTRVPVTPSLREVFDGNIWFVAKQALRFVTPLTLAPAPAQFVVADGKSGLYAGLTGRLKLVESDEIIEELWVPPSMSGTSKGQGDAGWRLLCFTPRSGSVWYSSTKGVTFLCDFEETFDVTNVIALSGR